MTPDSPQTIRRRYEDLIHAASVERRAASEGLLQQRWRALNDLESRHAAERRACRAEWTQRIDAAEAPFTARMAALLEERDRALVALATEAQTA